MKPILSTKLWPFKAIYLPAMEYLVPEHPLEVTEVEQFCLASSLLPLYGLCGRWSVVAASAGTPLQGLNFTAVCDQ